MKNQLPALLPGLSLSAPARTLLASVAVTVVLFVVAVVVFQPPDTASTSPAWLNSGEVSPLEQAIALLDRPTAGGADYVAQFNSPILSRSGEQATLAQLQ